MISQLKLAFAVDHSSDGAMTKKEMYAFHSILEVAKETKTTTSLKQLAITVVRNQAWAKVSSFLINSVPCFLFGFQELFKISIKFCDKVFN